MDNDNLVLPSSNLRKILASFSTPGFRYFYAHTTFASVDMSVRLALHGWLILDLSNNSEFWVGVYALVLGLGQFLFSMPAGAMLDRFQRKTVLLIEGITSAALIWGLAIGTFFEVTNLWLAISASFVMGCLQAVRFTGNNRLIYDLVGPEHLLNGMSLWRISATPMMILGAIFAGTLIDWYGIWASYVFMGVSLVTAIPFLALVRVRGEVTHSDISFLQQTIEGVIYMVKTQSLRTLFTVSLVMESLGFSFLIMVPIVAKNVLVVGGLGMGLIQGGIGIGSLVSMIVMAARGNFSNKPRIIFINAFCAGIALLGFSLSRSLPLTIFFAGAAMGFLMAYDLTLAALMQLLAPPNLRGRATSVHSLAISFTALGGFLMGVASSIVGVSTVLATASAGILVNSVTRRPALMRIEEHPYSTRIEP